MNLSNAKAMAFRIDTSPQGDKNRSSLVASMDERFLFGVDVMLEETSHRLKDYFDTLVCMGVTKAAVELLCHQLRFVKEVEACERTGYLDSEVWFSCINRLANLFVGGDKDKVLLLLSRWDDLNHLQVELDWLFQMFLEDEFSVPDGWQPSCGSWTDWLPPKQCE